MGQVLGMVSIRDDLTFGHILVSQRVNKRIKLAVTIASNNNNSDASPMPLASSASNFLNHTSDSSTLEEDLAYIDKTYYSEDGTMQSHNEKRKSNGVKRIRRRFTVRDASNYLDRSMEHLDLCRKKLEYIDSSIVHFKMIRTLDLSCNELTHLPEAIGCLVHLCFLNVSRNKLERLPEALGHLSRLVELNVSHNRITDLAPCFEGSQSNSNLVILHAKNNAITQLSSQVTNLTQLASLDLSSNPIPVLPAEISRLASLRRLILKDCPLVSTLPMTANSTPVTPIPSLKEYCARQIVTDLGHTADLCLPSHLHRYLKTAKACSVCRAPFFDTYVSRGQCVQKTAGGKTLLLEHRLCSAHWADCDDEDRILAMFATGHQPRETISSASPRKNLLFF